MRSLLGTVMFAVTVVATVAASAAAADASAVVTTAATTAAAASAAPRTSFVFGHARFTFVTRALVRLEWSANSIFDDRPTLTVVNRASAEPPIVTLTHVNATAVRVKSDAVEVTFDDASGAIFNAASLRVVAMTTVGRVEWAPGSRQTSNLNGTYTSLDCYSDSPMDCIDQYDHGGVGGPGWTFGMQPGLLARDGWTVIDDTATLRVGLDGWWSNKTSDGADLYFVSYGHDFRCALRDLAIILGPPGVPPRASLGVWWSRYFAYSAASLQAEVVDGFAAARIPLAQLSCDLDWHKLPIAPSCTSWGNNDFNTTLFPDPIGFINSLHAQGIHLTVNLHPQNGIDPCNERYAAFIAALNWTGPVNGTIACAFDDRRYVDALWSTYFGASPLMELDFFWADYSGCGGTSAPYNGATQHDVETQQLWSTHVFASEQRRAGARPFVLSRYGGLGNHRTLVAFSGDTYQHESALSWQTRKTASAANVMVSVSHDIGGNHFGSRCQPPGQGDGECAGASDPTNATSSELFLRWVQFGVFTAVFRTHCDHCERRPWAFPLHAAALADAYRLREALVPYLYSAFVRARESGVVPIHPVYFDASADEGAFEHDAQYMFGDDILVAPITKMSSSSAGDGMPWATYLPAGSRWARWGVGSPPEPPLVGPTVNVAMYAPSQIPVFVRAGAVIALKSPLADVSAPAPGLLIWTCWPTLGAGRDGAAAVLEDDGASLAFERGAVAVTLSRLASTHKSVTLTIAPTKGSFAGMPPTRAHGLQLRGVPAAMPTRVAFDGEPLPLCAAPCTFGWWRTNATTSPLLAPVGALNARAAARPTSAGAAFVILW